MPLTIYTKESAQALNPSYFKRLNQNNAAPQRTMLGRAMPVLHSDYSLIIVRVAHKAQRQTYYFGRWRERKCKGYYATKRNDYIVATINWDTGFVTELAAHPSVKAARADMVARHKAAASASESRQLS